jgi:uncharacterized protein (TIGR02284 family)
LRNKKQMALNRVETLCVKAADHYAAAAGKTSDPALARLFDQLAQQHRQFAADLVLHIRALDDLPQYPDPDKETMEDLITGIKAFFSGDERSILINEREQAEQDIEEAVQAALQVALPQETKSLLAHILEQVATTKHQLADAR